MVENKNKELLEIKNESESNNTEVDNIKKSSDELTLKNNKEIETLTDELNDNKLKISKLEFANQTIEEDNKMLKSFASKSADKSEIIKEKDKQMRNLKKHNDEIKELLEKNSEKLKQDLQKTQNEMRTIGDDEETEKSKNLEK